MILSSTVSDFTGEEVLSQCLTIGPYLLGLGLGSLFGEKETNERALNKLINIEWASSIILPLLPLLFILTVFFFINSHSSINLINSKRELIFYLGVACILSLITGLLGGSQLPLIFKLFGEKSSSEIVIGLNYLGPLFSGPLIVLLNNLAFETPKQLGIIVIIQVLGIVILGFRLKNKSSLLIKLTLPLILVINFQNIHVNIEYLTLKSIYLGTKINFNNLDNVKTGLNFLYQYGKLERVKTPYQVIDYFTTQKHPEIELEEESTLFLNRKTQFSDAAISPYHESMVYAGLNLFKGNAKNFLILGGGDGLLLKEIKQANPKAKITLVELDQQMIDWARKNPKLSKQNHFSLDLNKGDTNIIIDDAISYLRKFNSRKKFDIVLIDLPFPDGYELTKLYSIEFYTLLKETIYNDSIVIIDLPLQKEESGDISKDSKIILKTLEMVGFDNKLPFGPTLSFIALTLSQKKLAFDYTNFPNYLKLSTKQNLRKHITDKEMSSSLKSVIPNSMFRPNL